MPSEQAHWESVYAERDSTEVSWYEAEPALSLHLIESTGLRHDAALLDVGGGASKLARELWATGYTDITVADISTAALREAAAASEEGIQWVEADVRRHDFGREFDLWHDRAVFHFMTTPEDRDAYLKTLRKTLRPGGHLVVATFGPNGPTMCSGLPVARYGGEELVAALGDGFELISAGTEDHHTPSGKHQEFLYARLRRED